MADEALNLNITSNTSDLESALARIVQGLASVSSTAKATGADAGSGLDAMAGAATKASASTENLSNSTVKASRAMSEAKGEAFNFGEALEGLGAHARTVSMGLEAVGLSAEGSAAKVVGAVEAINGLGSAVPELLAIAVAFSAIAGAAEFMKDAVGEAAQMQNSMQMLGAAVQAQGGSWAASKEAVQEWAESESVASGVLASELIPALNNVVSAGHSLADSQKIVGVAEELAAQKGISLSEATNLLLRAEAGRGQGLVKLDNNLKDVVASHGHLSSVLQIVHHDMQDAISDNSSLVMTTARMHAEMESASDLIGQAFLPMLTAMAKTMLGAIANAKDLGSALVGAFASAVSVIADAASSAEHFAMAMLDISTQNWKGAVDEFQAGTKNVTHGFDDARKAVAAFQNVVKTEVKMPDAYARGNALIANDIKKHQDALKDLSLDNDPIMGNAPKGSKGGNPDATISGNIIAPEAISATKELETAQKALDAALKQVQDTLIPYQVAVATATTVEGENAAKKSLLAATAVELAHEHTLLNNAVAQETDAQKKLASEYSTQNVVVENARVAHNKLQEAILAEGGGTAEQKIRLQDLQNTYDTAKKRLADLNSEVQANTANLDKNRQALAENKKAIAEEGAAHDAFLRSLDQDRITRQQNLDDEIATHGKSIAAQVAYYQQQLSLLDSNDAANEERIKKLWDDIYDAEAEGYKKLQTLSDEANRKVLEDQTALDKALEDERKKSIEEATKDVDGFLNDILSKGESFKSAFSNLAKSISQNYTEAFSKMITGSSLFTNMMGGGNGAGTGNAVADAEKKLDADTVAASQAQATLTDATKQLPQPLQNVHDAVTSLTQPVIDLKQPVLDNTTAIQALTQQIKSDGSGGGTGSLSGGLGSGSSIPAGLGTTPSLIVGDYSATALAKITGSSLGVTANSVTANQNSETEDEFGMTSADNEGLINASAGANTRNGTGADISGGLSILQGLSSGGSFGEILGGAGGIVGTALGGPLGGAIGGTLGSIIGSLFGPHPSAAKDPDMFESSTGYGQDIADIENGPAAASGVNYSPSSAVAAFAKAMGVSAGTINGFPNMGQQSINSNGTTLSSGGIDAAEIWLSQNKNDSAAQLAAMNMTPAELSSDIALLGASSTGSGLITRYDKNIGDMEITGAGSGGNEKSTYSAMEAALNQIMGAYGAAGGSTGVYSLTHSLPSFEKTTMQQIGTFSNGVYTGSSTGSGLQSGSGSTTRISGPVIGGGGLTSGSSGNMHTLNVTIENHGIVVGQNGMAQLADQVSKALAKNYSVNYGNTSGRSF